MSSNKPLIVLRVVKTSDVSSQISAMNKAYASYGYQFTLAGTDFTVNSNWASNAYGSAEEPMKKKLRKGNVSIIPLTTQRLYLLTSHPLFS